MTSALLRRDDTQRQSRRRPCEDKGRDWGDKGMPVIAGSFRKLGRSKAGFFP